MNTITANTTTDAPTPTNEQLRRLAIDTAKYHGLAAGDILAVDEIREQAAANGYTEDRARELLDGIAGATKATVPAQSDEFGELWRVDEQECGTPGAVSPQLIEEFQEYCQNRENTFNHATARKRFARAKSVGRYFRRNYDTFTTVLITYTVDRSEEPIPTQVDSLYPRPVNRSRRNILKDIGAWDGYAGLKVLSPKYTTPGAVFPRVHGHTFLWIPGKHSVEDFRPLIDEHVANADGACQEDHPPESVTVEHWGPQHREPLPQGPDDVKRGASTTLAAEVGENLPYLKHPNAEYVDEWGAAMWQGADPNTIARWKTLGKPSRFKNIADDGRYYDRYREGAFAARAVAQVLPDLPEGVDESCAEERTDASPESSTIERGRFTFVA